MLAPKKKCTGCNACYNICPRDAISLITDSDGFVYPSINEDQCVNCSLCEKTCPVISDGTIFRPHINVFASYAEDMDIREHGTSGGIAGELIQSAIRHKGVAYAATFQQGELRHVRISGLELPHQMQGSKYIESKIGITYSQVLEDLRDPSVSQIVFIGTPCQVDGLLHFLRSKKTCGDQKLFTISFICGGVSNKTIMDELLKKQSFAYSGIIFRDKQKYLIRLVNDEGILYEKDRLHSLFYWGYSAHLITREACSECPYATKDRVGDITLGDFWGAENIPILDKETEKGLSLIIASTENGVKLCKEANIKTFEVSDKFPVICENNPRLVNPAGETRSAGYRIIKKLLGLKVALELTEGPRYAKLYIIKKIKKLMHKV